MDELDHIRQQKLNEMQAQQEDQLRASDQVAQAETVVKKLMTKEALQRYGTVKLAHPEVALMALSAMLQLVQAGRITEINDEALKQLLKTISHKKREINIRHK